MAEATYEALTQTQTQKLDRTMTQRQCNHMFYCPTLTRVIQWRCLKYEMSVLYRRLHHEWFCFWNVDLVFGYACMFCDLVCLVQVSCVYCDQLIILSICLFPCDMFWSIFVLGLWWHNLLKPKLDLCFNFLCAIKIMIHCILKLHIFNEEELGSSG
jgi:hypothetical protein